METFDLLRISCGEETNLGLGHEVDDLLDDVLEVLGEELVDFVEDEEFAEVEVGDVLVGQVEDPARGGDNDVDSLVEAVEVVADHRREPNF